jgi:integrase
LVFGFFVLIASVMERPFRNYFMTPLHTKNLTGSSALTFVRPGELRQARWHEFDFVKAEWRFLAAKMKMKIDHIAPLSKQALTILHELETVSVGSIMFSHRCARMASA